MGDTGAMDPAVQAYIDGISEANRPLFDRFDALVRDEFPAVEVVISYQMPTYRLGAQRLYVGAWKHGLSVYGWGSDRMPAFVERHPELDSGRGTMKLPVTMADQFSDDDLRSLIRAALEG